LESPDPGDIEDISGRLLKEQVLEVWKATPAANLLLTSASAVAKTSCYDDDACVAELYIQLGSDNQIVFYRKIIEKVDFVSNV